MDGWMGASVFLREDVRTREHVTILDMKGNHWFFAFFMFFK